MRVLSDVSNSFDDSDSGGDWIYPHGRQVHLFLRITEPLYKTLVIVVAEEKMKLFTKAQLWENWINKISQ